MDERKYTAAADEIINFVENELTNKLAEIYKSTRAFPFDTLNFLLCHLDSEENCENIINKANKLTKGE